MRGVLKLSVYLLCLSLLLELVLVSGVEFTFKRYSYKKKRDDKRYKHAKERCERAGICEGKGSVDFIKCLRECMSKKCYDELYGPDELEEGEVDVRLNSFKGCLYQQPYENF
ncbi:uncharacterized protein LOC124116715 [Haliotis rufescens]|uniref:uncharacterized protein LOC124116715 n=1 Tax=Haliotis rufescens TaxID=6454 RepID=UPI001EB03FBE|nr:uncharacterized protein LOC124116715 [Haliotis rufescens]XP_046334109.1 uncharacterized protein LOC124116715 [Haliotis rufescens]